VVSPVLPVVPSRRILVADDNDDAAESLTLRLQLAGHDVRTARNGAEALAIAGEFKPEIVLLDLGMPKMDGYDTAREIRKRPWGKRATLIALTGWGQQKDRQRTSEAGFDRHLVKPVDEVELFEALAFERSPAQGASRSSAAQIG
jgi:CheY-like chemotaxis protein